MSKRPSETQIKLSIANVIADADDYLFERLDKLHMHEIHDNDVIGYLRAEGMEGVAQRYIDWSGALDPDEDNTTMSPVVPDPGDAASYSGMGRHPLLPEGVNTIFPLGKIEDKRGPE